MYLDCDECVLFILAKNEIRNKFHYLFIYPMFYNDHNGLIKVYYRKFPFIQLCLRFV